jgi:2-methylaconitate cis-trans-isomerase PrpF
VPGTLNQHIFGSHMVAIPLGEPSASIEVHMVWRKGEASVPVANFLNCARNVFRGSRSRTMGCPAGGIERLEGLGVAPLNQSP